MDIDHKHEFDGKQDRNFHQKPFDDQTDELSQIDETSANLADKKETAENQDAAGYVSDRSGKDKEETESRDAAGYVNDINDDDVRDQQDSTSDWDAENSRTGRNK